MKKLLLSIILTILLFGILKSQNHPILEENKTWNVVCYERSPSTGSPCWPPKTNHITKIYKLSGDTLISGNLYNKVYYSTEEVPSIWELSCFLRAEAGTNKDSSNEKIFKRNVREPYNNFDYLIYDFSVNVGDTVVCGEFSYIGMFDHVVNKVTDTVMEDGSIRKAIYLTHNSGDDRLWIEGIGGNIGFIDDYMCCLMGKSGSQIESDLLCHYEGSTKIYDNPLFDVCYLHVLNWNNPQTITWNQDLHARAGDPPIALTATATSGLDIYYVSRNTDVAEIINDNNNHDSVRIIGPGFAPIDAYQYGTCFWGQAPTVRDTIYVEPLGVGSEAKCCVYVYPNPVSDMVTINTNDLKSELYLFDSRGVLILNTTLNHGENKINIGNIKNGVYIYKVISVDKAITGKLIKI